MLPPRQRGFLLFLSTLPDLALYARKVWSLTKASIGLMIWKKASYLLVRSSRLKILLTLLKQLKKTITKLIKLGLALRKLQIPVKATSNTFRPLIVPQLSILFLECGFSISLL